MSKPSITLAPESPLSTAGSNERRNSRIFIPFPRRGRGAEARGSINSRRNPEVVVVRAGAEYCVATLGQRSTLLLDRGLDRRGGRRRGAERRRGRGPGGENIMQARILAARLNICRQVARLGHAPWLEPFVHPRAST